MIKNFINLVIFIFSLFYLDNSFAFVAQEAKEAMSFNNIYRGTSSSENKESTNESDKELFYDDSINYEEIGNKLLNKKQQKLYINLFKTTTKNIKMSKGYSFFVVLPEEQGCFWNIDNDEKIIIAKSSTKETNKRIIEFTSVGYGVSKIFLDNICKQYNNQKVIQSRIIRVKVN